MFIHQDLLQSSRSSPEPKTVATLASAGGFFANFDESLILHMAHGRMPENPLQHLKLLKSGKLLCARLKHPLKCRGLGLQVGAGSLQTQLDQAERISCCAAGKPSR